MNAQALDTVLRSLPLPLVVVGLLAWRSRMTPIRGARSGVIWGPAALAGTTGVVLAWTQVGAMALLAAGVLTASTIAAWWALGLVAWFLVLRARRDPAGAYARPEDDSGGAGPDTCTLLIWCVIAGVIALQLAMAAVPPWYRDEMVYHLALPQQFVAAHGYVRPDDNIFASFPLGWESIVSAAMAAGVGNPRALGVWVTLADALAIAGIAGRLGAPAVGRATAAAAYLLIPTVCEFGPSAYVEPWLVLVSLLGLDAALAAQDQDARPHLSIQAGIWAGLAASAKFPGLVIALGLAAALPARRRAPAIAAMLIVGAPFYLRNLVERGNPVFPLGWDLFGGPGWDAVRAWAYALTLEQYGAGRSVLDFLLLIPRLFTTRELHAAFEGSVGPVLLLGAWGLRGNRLLLFGAIGWTLWWGLTVEQVRFWLPAAALLAIGLGLVATGPLRGGGVVLAGLLWAKTPVTDLWRVQQTTEWWAGTVSREALLDRMLPESAAVYRQLPDYVPADGRVWLVWMRGFTWDFPRDYRIDCVFEAWRLEAALQADSVPSDVSHLLVNERFFLKGTNADWTATARLATGRTDTLRQRWAAWISEGRISEVKRWGSVALYQVGP